jgi:hypothetical protein
MGAIQAKASSTQGTRSHLARAQPRAGTVVQANSRLAQGPPQATGAPSTRLKPSSGRLRCEATLANSPSPTDRIAGAFNARIAWHFILTHAPQSARSKWPQSLRPSTDRPDRKTAPLAPLRLLCHPPGWGWQQLSSALGATGSSASPDLGPRPQEEVSASLDPRARLPPQPRKAVSASPDPRARPQPRPRKAVFASPDPRARPQPRPRKMVSASPDPRARPQPWPREESRPRPTPASASGGISASPNLGLGPTTPQGVHHYPTPS